MSQLNKSNHDWFSLRHLERENRSEFEKVWKDTVEEVERLTRNKAAVIEVKMVEAPELVTISENEKWRYYEYKFWVNGFECELDWWKPKLVELEKKEKAQYVIWDPHSNANRCYIRDLMKDPFNL